MYMFVYKSTSIYICYRYKRKTDNGIPLLLLLLLLLLLYKLSSPFLLYDPPLPTQEFKRFHNLMIPCAFFANILANIKKTCYIRSLGS